MADPETINVYAAQIDAYRALVANAPDPALEAFLARLPQEARILDLGCGPGHSAAQMAAAGFRVDATDACPEMVAVAAGHPGVTARVEDFAGLDAENIYDAVWASFSLLHAPRADMPGHLARIHRALKPEGWLHLGLKTGSGEARDKFGRFYAYYTVPELRDLLEEAGFTIEDTREGKAKGLSGQNDPYVLIAAHA